MRNKKAASIILFIFEVLVVLIVVGMSLYLAKNFAKSENIQKELFTEDLRMMVNALIAVPGDAVVQFPQNSSLYVFVLTTHEIIGYIRGQEENALGKVRKSIFLPQGHTASGVVEGVERICLEKRNKHIALKPCSEVKLVEEVIKKEGEIEQ